jgi:phage recombination protein Bet
MKSVAKKENTDVVKYDPQLVSTLRNSLYPGAKEESVIMVIHYCHHAKLDIMLKPVHIVPMWIVDKETGSGEMRDVVMPGINLYRIQASRSGCAGISEPEFGEDVKECLGGVDVTYPKWCKVTVKRVVAGHLVEFSATEYWKENYATAGKDKKTGTVSVAPNAMWKKRPYGQLAKCAEAQALRKGFPEIGAAPTAEEMEGKHLDSEEYDQIQKDTFVKKKGVDKLKEKLGMRKDAEEAEDAEFAEPEFDEVTGETEEPPKKAEKIETQGMSADTLKFLIESADSRKELNDAMKNLKDLSANDKKSVYELYKKKDAELQS